MFMKNWLNIYINVTEKSSIAIKIITWISIHGQEDKYIV